MKPTLLLGSLIKVNNTFTPNERTILKGKAKRNYAISRLTIFLLILFSVTGMRQGFAQTNTWNGGSGNNWSSTGAWSLGHVPLATEDVVMLNNKTMTINMAAVCKSFTINAGNNANTVTISGTNSLTVTNGVSINAGTGNNDDKIINVGNGTLTAASITLAETGGDNRSSEVTLSTGTINITGDISMDGSAARNAIRFSSAGTLNLGGNFTGTNRGVLVPSTGTVNCNGANPQILSGATTTTFYNLTINKDAAANTVTSSGNAFSVANNLTVTQGNLLLEATNANYAVSNDVIVSANGTVTHSVDWDATGKLFSIAGNIAIDGLFTYTVRSHVQMNSGSNENVRTGANNLSAFSILTLMNGNFYANGVVRVNDNFWAMFGTGGSFHTNGQNVYSNATCLNAGGTIFIDGGSLNVTGGLANAQGVNGTVNLSNGSLNTDALTIGSGATGTVVHSGGTANINGNLLIAAGSYTCTGPVAINILGNWTNNVSTAAFTPGSSTVSFNNSSATQSINGTVATQSFNNVQVNKSGQQLTTAGSLTTLNANGTVTLITGAIVAGSATAINVAGNWVNNGGSLSTGATNISFNGTTSQNISGSIVTDFPVLNLNNASGLSLSTDVMVTNLTLTNGKITTAANKVIMGTTSAITGASTSRYIIGNLQWAIPTGTPTRVFEVGDAGNYAPMSVVFNNVTVAGNVTGYSIGGEHPAISNSLINESKNVNRYWGLINSGVSLSNYTPTYNFQTADIDAGANTAVFIVGRHTSSWGYPTIGTRTANSTSATLGSFGEYCVGEGGASKPVISTQPSDITICSGPSVSYTAAGTAAPTPSVTWEISTNGGVSFSALTILSPYSVSTLTAAGITTSTLTINPTTVAMDDNQFRAIFSNSRGKDTSYEAYIRITASPIVNVGAALSPICGSAASAPLGGSVGGSATGGTWTTSSGGTFSPNANTLNATWTPPIGFTGTATLLLTTTGGACGSTSNSKTQVVNMAAGAVTVTPASSSICNNGIQTLSASNVENKITSSGAVNVAIPNVLVAGVTNTLAVSGIPAGATITGVSVTMNVTHTKVNDLIVNLRAPNGNILNLANRVGTTGANFTNTIVSSTGVPAFSTGTPPYSSTYKADATNGVGATGQVSNVTAFSSLYTVANGNWVLALMDNVLLNAGTLNSWSLTITYIDPITWAPVTGLYTNAGATTAYTGQALTTVYAKPATPGVNIYTATATTANGCIASANATVTTGPVVTITTDYCYGGGKIQLTAVSTPAASSWLWNTGATTQSILVDIAGLYQVTSTTSGGCVGTASASVAQELVTNGNFSAGNTGFTSSYSYVAPTVINGLYPEGTYSVNEDPSVCHNLFFGRDHTTNTGKFMIVNGSATTINVWQQTLPVQPGTVYYFSAWAISVNSYPPFAELQFNVNGTAVGTTAVLAAGPTNNNPPYNWVRFYGSWTAGAGVTSAIVSVRDLQTALGGNDFGLDDISFGTLSTFITQVSAPATNMQTLCKNTAMQNIIYSVGSGAAGPTVTGLPVGVSSAFNGVNLTISGTPTTAGSYNYTITTTGTCNPVSVNGIIVVREDAATLTSAVGSDAQIVCINSAINNITYLISPSATGATVSGLPAGVTGNYAAGIVTISGTPSTAAVYNYTVTTTGGCTPVAVNGTITVRRQIITRTSAAGTNSQQICINNAITNITYSLGGTATGASVSGLPAGISGSLASGVYTISGTATVSGVFNYTVTTSGTCAPVISTGTITVNAQKITLSSATGTNVQAICTNNAITTITYNVSGSATNASATGLPPGVTGTFTAGVFTISGTATASGTFNYTVTTSGTCTAVTATGTITVTPIPVGGTIADASICFADNGTLTLTGSTGTVVRWEVSVNAGSSWTNISNVTSSQAFTGLTQTTWYRALVQSGACASPVYSNTAKVGIHNLWTGTTSSDWNDNSNWSDGLAPSTSCPDVTIPLLTAPNVYPQLTSGIATVNNLVIYASATMQISNATLQVAGSISNSGTLIASNGTIELNGTTGTQSVTGSVFDQHTIKNLIISNSNGVSFNGTNDTMKITGLLSFGISNSILNTNNNLTLVSNASGTASVGDLTNGGASSGNNIIGNVTVERYIPLHPKAWQFLATPTSGQSINNAWQEANTTLANTRSGYGTIITGHMANAVAMGFDIATPSGPSMKVYNPASNGWDGVSSTTIPIANKKGYMFFVRGDRSVTTFASPATFTTLRTTGKLFTFGADAPASSTVAAGKLESIGNPYASAIDFRLITKPAAPAIDDAFYVWDPLLTNNYLGLGGYQTISAANGWKPIPGGTANYDANIPAPYIQSGQAFFMHATGAGGTVSFSESNKTNQIASANRELVSMPQRQFMRVELYNASDMLSDGNVVAFDEAFTNEYDANDALKVLNTGENISIVNNGKLLALEARSPVVTEDTVFYTFSNIRRQAYRLKFRPENMSAGVTAYLVDKFTNSSTSISLTDTSSYNFSITTEAGTWAADRFCLVFKQAPPMSFTSVNAVRNQVNGPVSIDWSVCREKSIQHYEVQRSANGTIFSNITVVAPTGNNCSSQNYQVTDLSPLRGTNYYRVKALKSDGTDLFSSIIKLIPGKDQLTGKNNTEADESIKNVVVEAINIYPNPVVNKLLNLQFVNQAAGSYNVVITNSMGEAVHKSTFRLSSDKQVQSIKLPNTISAGNYQVNISGASNTNMIKQVVIE